MQCSVGNKQVYKFSCNKWLFKDKNEEPKVVLAVDGMSPFS